MIAGARVMRTSDSKRGTVVRCEDGNPHRLVVDVDGVEYTWSRSSVVILSRTYEPRGLVKVDDRMRAAARLVAEGSSRRAVAEVYGVAASTVADWIERVRDDERIRGAR